MRLKRILYLLCLFGPFFLLIRLFILPFTPMRFWISTGFDEVIYINSICFLPLIVLWNKYAYPLEEKIMDRFYIVVIGVLILLTIGISIFGNAIVRSFNEGGLNMS